MSLYLYEHGTLRRNGLLVLDGTLFSFGNLGLVGALLDFGVLASDGTLADFGILFFTGTLSCFGGLELFGTLVSHGFLAFVGTLLKHGFFVGYGTLRTYGVLPNCGTPNRAATCSGLSNCRSATLGCFFVFIMHLPKNKRAELDIGSPQLQLSALAASGIDRRSCPDAKRVHPRCRSPSNSGTGSRTRRLRLMRPLSHRCSIPAIKAPAGFQVGHIYICCRGYRGGGRSRTGQRQ
jgi:hypothetical protein